MSSKASLASRSTTASSRSSSACPLDARRSCVPRTPERWQYEIYFKDDQSECIVVERYRDSDALMEHFAHIGDLMEAILATSSVSGELLGNPSAELSATMADTEVRLFTRFQSM